MSSLYTARVMHHRFSPEYRFNHSVCMFLLDLDEMAKGTPWLLGFNRPGLFTFRDKDHFRFRRDRALSTRQKVDEYFGERPLRVQLLTNLRILGYTFNPVSFYFCDFSDGRTEVLVEVNNTYGEQKPYLVRANTPDVQQKSFYVSPFIRHDRSFRFRIARPGRTLRIEISAVSADNRLIMKGVLAGRQQNLSNTALAAAFLRFPFVTLKIIALIHWHALRLYWKGVPHFGKAETDQKLKELNNV
jgi:DUF1365 family protein